MTPNRYWIDDSMNDLDKRRKSYSEWSAYLAGLDDRQLARLIKPIPDPVSGWGSNGVLQLGRKKLFVKCVPLTDLEHENLHSTKNLHNLPTYYQYGLGSLGFGANREILTHIKTTNWVLDGSCPNFPMMFHHRILPRPVPQKGLDPKDQASYLLRWNNSRTIGSYRDARASARHQAFLFLEFFPKVLSPWASADVSRLEPIIPQVLETLSFLRSNGIIHFDAHHWNIVSDGHRPYLTDFGLATDLSFQLSKTEHDFYARNTHYDFGEFLSCAVGYAFGHFRNLPLRRRRPIARHCGLVGGETTNERMAAIRDHLETAVGAGLIDLPKSFVDMVVRYREIDRLHRDFYAIMLRGPRKHYKYENAKLKALLRKAEK